MNDVAPRLGSRRAPAPVEVRVRSGTCCRIAIRLLVFLAGFLAACGARPISSASGVPPLPTPTAIAGAPFLRLIETYRVARPLSIAVAPSAVWVSGQTGQVVRIPLHGDAAPVRMLALASSPTRVAYGLGNAWVSVFAANEVVEVSDQMRIEAVIPHIAEPNGITVDSSGVWVAGGDGTITRILPACACLSLTFHPGGVLELVSADQHGHLWFSDYAGDRILMLTEASPTISRGFPLVPGCGPEALAVAPSYVWVVCYDSQALERISLTEGRSFPVPLPATKFVAVPAYVCPAGPSVWVTDAGSPLLHELDAASGQQVRAYTIPRAIDAYGYIPVVVTAGSVWIVDPADDRLLRLADPNSASDICD